MPKTQHGVAAHNRRKRVLKRAKGYFGRKSKLFRTAQDAVDKSGVYAYRDRRKKKSEWRQLWIVRINTACRAQNIAYSRFMNGLKKAGIALDRKSISELAIMDAAAFNALVIKAKAALQT